MKVTFFGTRGSQPTPGHDTVRYGGNTSCVEVRVTDGSVLALDAGTGLRTLGLQLTPDIQRVDILLTHLHMDHIQGLGFFTPLFQPGFEVHLWGPSTATAGVRARLTKYMSPPLFPVRLPELPCDLHVHDVDDMPFDVPGARVRAALVCHPGATVGYRVETDDASLAYVPDHEPALACERFAQEPMWCSGHDLATGVDLLVHDAQYDEQEYAQRVGWGHSTLRHALDFARLAGVGTFVPFHYDPGHDDDALDAFFATADSEDVPVTPAREGEHFVIANHQIRAVCEVCP